MDQNVNIELEGDTVTVDYIISQLRNAVEKRLYISPEKWVDAALKLITLMEDEDNKLAELESIVAEKRVLLQDGESVARAELLVRATKEYRDFKTQERKNKRIEEFIRIAKKQADVLNK